MSLKYFLLRLPLFSLIFLFDGAMASPLGQLKDDPSLTHLAYFRKDCLTKRAPHREGFEADLNQLALEPEQVVAIRAVLIAASRCTEGELQKNLIGHLGVDNLFKNPANLMDAISEENIEADLIQKIAATDGSTGKEEFADCGHKCEKKAEDFYQKKTDALKSIKVGPKKAAVQKKLLEAISEASKHYLH